MKLHADKPWMIDELDDLYKITLRKCSDAVHAFFRKQSAKFIIEFETMTMPFVN